MFLRVLNGSVSLEVFGIIFMWGFEFSDNISLVLIDWLIDVMLSL